MTAPQRHVANTANYMLRLQWFSMARIFIAPSAMLFNGAEIPHNCPLAMGGSGPYDRSSRFCRIPQR